MTLDLSFPPCYYCNGHGWIAVKVDWEKCGVCFGSGYEGQVVPEILTTDGRIARNYTMHLPAKPKPTLRIVK
jgi:hypothetical protein